MRNVIAYVRVWVLFVVTLFLLGCGRGGDDYARMMSVETTTEVSSGWQYRWGDSPKIAGAFSWLLPAEEGSSEWNDFTVPASSPPNRPSGGENVWLRTTIPDLHGRADFLYVLGFDQAAEVYLDGKRIYGYGDIDASGKGRFAGYVWHLIPLSPGDSGKRIYFRIWSSHVNIGIVGKVFLGPKSAFVRGMFEESLPNLVASILLTFMGIIALAMFLAKRSQSEYFYFFIHTFIGYWLFTRTSMKLFLLQNVAFWLEFELICFVFASIGLLGFSDAVFGPGLGRFPRWFARSGFLLAAGVPIWAQIDFSSIMRILLPIQLYMLFGVVVIVVQLVAALRRGMFEAKVVVVGLLSLLAIGVLEILIAMGILFPGLMGRATLAPWGLLGFVFSLGIVLVLRFAAVYRRVGRLKAQLEKLLLGTKQMAVAREKVEATSHAVQHIINEIELRPGCGAEVFLRHERGGNVQYQAARLAEGHGVMVGTEVRRLDSDEVLRVEDLVSGSAVTVTSDEKLMIPIYWGEQKSGLIVFDQVDGKRFGPEENDFVSTLVNSLALSLSNIDFLAETRAKAQLDAEIAAAQAVQESLLPPSTHFPGLEIVSLYTPAGHTGGDWIGYYYDTVNHRLDVYMADVTGHGFAASLLTGVACGGVYTAEDLLTAIARRSGTRQSAEERLAYVAHVVNAIVMQTGRGKLMMTMAMISLDLLSGEITYLNAGHNPPYLISKADKKARGVPGSGSRLGFTAEPKFTPVKRQLQAGDSIFMFTDGLLENTGPDGKATYPERELRKHLVVDGDASTVHGTVLAAARAVWADHPPADDVTAMLIQWSGPISPDSIKLEELVLPGARKVYVGEQVSPDLAPAAAASSLEMVSVPVPATGSHGSEG